MADDFGQVPTPGGTEGNGGYYPPPAPHRTNSGGCFKIASITCGVLAILMLVFFVAVGVYVKKQLRIPNSGVNKLMQTSLTTQQGIEICSAIDRYRNKTGKFPDKLADLVPSTLYTDSQMHSPCDPNHDPNHISWTYIKPTEQTAASAPMIEITCTIINGEQSVVVLSRNGKAVMLPANEPPAFVKNPRAF